MRKALLLALTGLLACTGVASADDFPQKGKPITFVVPSTAGGGADTAARLLAPLLEKDLGVPVEVVNKPGASMQIGLGYVATAKPDGQTIALLVLPTAASGYLDTERKSPFGRDSLVPIGLYYGAPFGIVVTSSSPFKTLKDVVDAAKAKPGKIKAGTSGFMATGHFAALAFENGTGTKLATVNFQGGGPQLTALMGGHTDVSMNSIGELVTQQKSGALRILAVMSDKRDPNLPDVPTVGEAGYPEIGAIGSDIGLAAPAGTPQAVIDRLTLALKTAMDDPTLKERMTEYGNTLSYLPPAEYAAFWDKVDARFKPLIEAARKQGQ
ncbi:tripartite tricarboxylate transporter substrate binding protein [Ancylobacter sp. MQZ15Z-1]|uniref:Tripartite tricarboxylate transporter substrate binding protein n=1 Tax=Ancylobacter mangrovi TaxID=2972472 RepID=A0A9X2PEG8_9HYPH|nr:tripartite tricarboxylate transporter substrate binding protein [Ancylobacter mangrovi]MCS0494490.1 tripartite tricarboxylate transporter substrate binding protein [Ancylobacter mangrovi]